MQLYALVSERLLPPMRWLCNLGRMENQLTLPKMLRSDWLQALCAERQLSKVMKQ